jgi:hypothetical protein
VLGIKVSPNHCPITQIHGERAASLERKWRLFQSVVAEEAPSRSRFSLNHLCPEVSYEIYGYFASDLAEYVEDIDREVRYRLLERDGATDQFDPRWETVIPRHYTECREYSIHGTFAAGKPSRKPARPGELNQKRRWQALARDSFTCVYCGRKPPEVTLHVDHKVSIKDGGTDDLDNLVTACHECNAGKGPSSV